MSRRLPVYLILDTSHSMGGQPLRAVEQGILTVINSLMNTPQALETAALSIITFSTTAQQLLPLTELSEVVVPTLKGKGWTHLGEALTLAAERAAIEVVKNTPETKGDWKPMVFIMSDGHATDNLNLGVERFKKFKWGIVVACAVGRKIDDRGLEELHSITENVIQLEDASPLSISSFFKWVSQSIVTNSMSIGTGKGDVSNFKQLPPPPPQIAII